MLKNSDLESILTRVHQWTWQADHKVNVMLAALVAGAALLVPPLTKWFLAASDGFRFFIVLGGLFYLAGVYNAVRAVFPDTTNPHKPLSITFFGHIDAVAFDDYATRVNSITEEELRHDFLTQIHVCARIASRKFKNFRLACLLGGVGLGVLAVSFWIYSVTL